MTEVTVTSPAPIEVTLTVPAPITVSVQDQGPKGDKGDTGPEGDVGPLLDAHINSPTPHPIYDDGPSFLLLYQNAKV
jgi:hypothetical protein